LFSFEGQISPRASIAECTNCCIRCTHCRLADSWKRDVPERSCSAPGPWVCESTKSYTSIASSPREALRERETNWIDPQLTGNDWHRSAASYPNRRLFVKSLLSDTQHRQLHLRAFDGLGAAMSYLNKYAKNHTDTIAETGDCLLY
jgi:hypothetical protein